jgi:hypothetical protein
MAKRPTDSSGIEQLLALAAVNPDFAAALLSDRQQALSRCGVVLTPSEERLLASLDDARLDQLVIGVKRAMTPDPARRALVGGAAATLLGALATSGCQRAGGNVRAAVEEFRARVTAGGGGITGIRPGHSLGFGRPRKRPWLAVRQTKVVVRGGLGREIIRRIVRRHINELRYCFQKNIGLEAFDESALGAAALRSPVKLTTAFVIAPSGQVASVQLLRCSLKDKRLSKKLSRCVLKAMGRWLYPKPRGRPVQVEYGFRFEVVDPRKKKKNKNKKRNHPKPKHREGGSPQRRNNK